jgi:dTMP kinase
MAAWLFNKSKKYDEILLTREPTNSDVGKKIRRILETEKDPMASARKCAELYVADRRQHVRENILPALEKNCIVICDRYKHSTLTFQHTQGIPMPELVEMHGGLPAPDLTVILDVPVEEALKRIGDRSGGKEKFEERKFMNLLRVNYLALPRELEGEKIIVVNALGSRDKVFERVKKAIEKSKVLPY